MLFRDKIEEYVGINVYWDKPVILLYTFATAYIPTYQYICILHIPTYMHIYTYYFSLYANQYV